MVTSCAHQFKYMYMSVASHIEYECSVCGYCLFVPVYSTVGLKFEDGATMPG